MRLGLGASNTMRREQAVLTHHPSHTAVTNITPLFTIGGNSWPKSTPVEKLQTGTRFFTLLVLI